MIESLRDRELAFRVRAYKLLQKITSQQVQQAIAPGILLELGDKVYSVYQAGICYTDQDYFMNDEVGASHFLIKQKYLKQCRYSNKHIEV